MAPAKQHPDLLSCNFNQDFSCVAVGTRRGYSIVNCDPFGKIYSKSDGPTAIVEMLFCTSLVALVGAADSKSANSSPRRLQIVNTKRQSVICELLFPTTILAVRMNRKRLIVVLELEIYIYDISTMKLLHTLETGPNPDAICALSPSNDNSYLAYPAPTATASSPLSAQPPATPPATTGTILIFDTLSLTALNIITAHKSPIAALAINAAGTQIATASDKGTVIRVFSVPDADKLGEYRRGTKSARVWSMNFNMAGTLLVVGSDTETVHVYRLDDGQNGNGKGTARRRTLGERSASQADSIDRGRDGPSPPPSEAPSSPTLSSITPNAHQPASPRDKTGGATSSFSRRTFHVGKNLVGGMGGYLPKGVTDIWEPKRDFAFARMRGGGGGRCVVAMSPSAPYIMVITAEGLFQAYSIDLETGGECALIKEFQLVTDDEGNGMLD